MKKGLFTLLMCFLSIAVFSQARVQVIHNSPLPGTDIGPVVDIYVNGGLLPELTAVPFRAATPFLDVPAGVDLTIDIKVSPSTPGSPNVASFDIGQLADSGTYVVIANGVVGDPDKPFNLAINGAAKETADDPSTVEVAAFHGSPDAPNVDIGLRTIGNAFTDLPFGEYTTYAPLAEDIYYIDIKAAGDDNIVATFAADLNGLAGGAATIFASGFLGDMPSFGLFAALPDGTVVALPAVNVSRVQIIHNAIAPTVDVYASGLLLASDFEFREATEFFFAPAGIPLDIQVVPAGGDPMMDDVYTGPNITLENGATYVVVASGVLGDPTVPFGLQIEAAARETAGNPDLVAANILHGSPDAPDVNIDFFGVVTGDIVDGLGYGSFSGYQEIPAAPYFVEVEIPALGGVVVPFYADLRGLEGGAATVFASGLLLGTPGFGVFAALPDGTVVELPLIDELANVQLIHNSPSAGAEEVDLYLNGGLWADDFPFRAATPFVGYPAGIELEFGFAPANSTSVADTIANFSVNLATDENYIVTAAGLIGDADFPFGLQVRAGAKEMADDPATVEFTALHSSPGAPNVDIDARAVGNLIADLAYGTYTDYTAVPPSVYYLDVKAAGSDDIVATFEAPLDLFEGQAVTVFASGLLGGDPAFGLFAVDALGNTYPLEAVSIARYQIIHNSPSPTVDIYFNDALAYAGVEFRQATPYDFAPADAAINVKIVPAGGDIADAVLDTDVTFDGNGSSYSVVATGIAGDADAPLTLAAFQGAREASEGGVDLLLYHGSTDAPEVDVIASGTTDVLFDNVAYGAFSDDYLNVPAGVYELGITPSNDNSNELVTYLADVSGLDGGAATVFASGFFSGDDPAFEVWVALPDGTTFPLSVVVATNDLAEQINQFSMFPNPVDNFAFIQLDLEESMQMEMQIVDMAGRVIRSSYLGNVDAGAQQLEMDFSELAMGMYSIRLITNEGSASLKFIKK